MFHREAEPWSVRLWFEAIVEREPGKDRNADADADADADGSVFCGSLGTLQ